MGITGILAAVAIPQYNKYRKGAALSALKSTMGGIKSAFNACVASKGFSECDNRVKIGVPSCTQCISEGGSAPKYCSGLKTEIGGQEWQACIEIDASTGGVTETFSEGTCYDDSGLGNVGTLELSAVTPNTNDTAITPTIECTTSTDCTNAGMGAIHCSLSSTGICDTSTAQCG